ncbi:MAG: UvrD-helicase domain-containing protein, partial [Pseudomonadota bacterium]
MSTAAQAPRRVVAPTQAQRLAAAPGGSAWVSANAGSGKTRVLIHRVARLLLAGARPERILCLTYTRAAAAEMQTRLFAELGTWAMLPDAPLAAEIAALEGAEIAATPQRLALARQLFARALETPGGLRIQTIHAFCEHLLRRFPVEAAVSPRFQVADERQSAALERALRAGLAGDAAARPVFDRIAGRVAETTMDGLIGAIAAARHHLPRDPAEVIERLAPHFDPTVLSGDTAAVKAAAVARLDERELHALAASFAVGGSSAQKLAPALAAAVAVSQDDPVARFEHLAKVALKQDGDPRTAERLITKTMQQAEPATLLRFEAMRATIVAAQGALLAMGAAERARDLGTFAAHYLSAFEAAKAGAGLLDFDDMIARTAALLTRAEMAAWVLYKLDGGLDHILVDEAQDTAPAQWQVIGALA